MKAEIYPLEKIVIDGNTIYLNMERTHVEALIGKGRAIGTRIYYLNNEIAIDYNGDKVDFIEFLSGIDGSIRPVIYGVSVFDTAADALLEILKKQNGTDVDDSEAGYSYRFRNISVGIYREAVPEEIEEMVKEAGEFGNPMSEDEIRYEMKRADH